MSKKPLILKKKKQINIASTNIFQVNYHDSLALLMSLFLSCVWTNRLNVVVVFGSATLLSPSCMSLSLQAPEYLLPSFHPQPLCPHVPIVLSACPLFPSWLRLPPYMPPMSW